LRRSSRFPLPFTSQSARSSTGSNRRGRALEIVAIAREKENSGDLDGAIEGYRRAAETDPTCAEAWHDLGLAAEAAGDHDEARHALRKAVALKPDSAEGWFDLGNTLIGLGESVLAARAYRKCQRLTPDDPRIWFNLGFALCQSERRDQARDAYREALRRSPADPAIWFNIGNTYLDQGMWNRAAACYHEAQAVECFKASIKIDEETATYLLNRAMAHARLGAKEDAARDLERALDLNPLLEELIADLEPLHDLVKDSSLQDLLS
jgi:tetratricopeptide (TPR) repeat protein